MFELEWIEDTGENICFSFCVGLGALFWGVIGLIILLDEFLDTLVVVSFVDFSEMVTLGDCVCIKSFLSLVVEFLLDEKKFLTLDNVFLLITEVGWVWSIGVDGCDGLGEEIEMVAILSFPEKNKIEWNKIK